MDFLYCLEMESFLFTDWFCGWGELTRCDSSNVMLLVERRRGSTLEDFLLPFMEEDL